MIKTPIRLTSICLHMVTSSFTNQFKLFVHVGNASNGGVKDVLIKLHLAWLNWVNSS